MKITHANERKPEFVTKHEVGKVYQSVVGVDEEDFNLYLLTIDRKEQFRFVDLENNVTRGSFKSLREVDTENQTDILVDCELVIKGE